MEEVIRIVTSAAPQAIGPYSQAVSIPKGTGEWLLVSGQLPLDPETGLLVTGGIQPSVRRVLDNIEAILMAAGFAWVHVVKTEIFLTDLQDFKVVNEAYQQRFETPPYPARQTIQVAALPLGAMVEISCWAYKPEAF